MSDYGFSDIFSQKHSHFSFYIYFFRVFQHLMLKITPPFTFHIIYIHYLCPTSQQHYGYLIKTDSTFYFRCRLRFIKANL